MFEKTNQGSLSAVLQMSFCVMASSDMNAVWPQWKIPESGHWVQINTRLST